MAGRTVRAWRIGTSVEPPAESSKAVAGTDEIQWFAPSNRAKRTGGFLYQERIYDWVPRTQNAASLSNSGSGSVIGKTTLHGAHVFCAVLGSDNLAVTFLNELRQQSGVPEMAVLGVENVEEVQRVERFIDSLRVWPASGFAVLPIEAVKYFPEGQIPTSYKEEFLRVHSSGGRAYLASGVLNDRHFKGSHRGCLTLQSGEDLTFWLLYVSASVVGTPWYKKLKLNEGVQLQKVILLESPEQMKKELLKVVKHFKGWMDFEVMTGLKKRDEILRQKGFPDNPQWGDDSNDGKIPVFIMPDGKVGSNSLEASFFKTRPKRTLDNCFGGGLNPDLFTVLEGLEEKPKFSIRSRRWISLFFEDPSLGSMPERRPCK
eukprot:jgi/Botrbrau1/5417/Bobra.182_1s0021.1